MTQDTTIEYEFPPSAASTAVDNSTAKLGSQKCPVDLTEYRCLRAEILNRIKLRQQILLATTVVLGATFTVNGGHAIYPVLAAVIAMAWLQNDSRIKLLAVYIRAVYESSDSQYNFGWEHFIERNRTILWVANVVYPHGLFFVLTQMFTLYLIRDFYFSQSPNEHTIFMASSMATGMTVVLFGQKIHAQKRLIYAPTE